jgi:hypothetical protein
MDCENVNTGGLEFDLQPETRAERGFLQLRAAGALLQESQAEVNCRGNGEQGDAADSKKRGIIGLLGCGCALRGQGDGEKHDSRHRPAHGAISSVNCH